MHAYASEDPVFVAMNQRGQEETDGELDNFCIQCHAPLANLEGVSTDGTNLDELSEEYQGVTCAFCHMVDGVEELHNNGLTIADDGDVRGPFNDPQPTTAHGSVYSALHDRAQLKSSDLCGSCHDVVTQNGLFLERTYDEWSHSLYNRETDKGGLTCSGCHMDGRDGLAATSSTQTRRLHNHAFPGVDVALVSFPQQDTQRQMVDEFLQTAIWAELCVEPTSNGTRVTVTLENVTAGHAWPSGAAQDRRAWVELVATRSHTNDGLEQTQPDHVQETLFQSGVVADDVSISSIEDPNLWSLRDFLFDDNDEAVHMFWEGTSVQSELLPAPTTPNTQAPDYVQTHLSHEYELEGIHPESVTMRVRMRPIGLDIIDDLIESGHLDPIHRSAIPTLEVTAEPITWSVGMNTTCVP